MVGRHRVYRNIGKREEFLGLELIDALFLLFFFGVFSLFSVSLVARLSIFSGAYLGLRLFKKGKPERYLWSVIRFIRSPKAYPAFGKNSGKPYPHQEEGNGTDQTQNTGD